MAKQYKICHSGITWSMAHEDIEWAIKDIAELGYYGLETLAPTVTWWNENRADRGGFRRLLQRYELPLEAIYGVIGFFEPKDASDWVSRIKPMIDAGQAEGAQVLVLQAGSRRQLDDHGGKYPYWDALGAAFNEVAAYAKDRGMVTAIHPHTRTLVELPDEIDAILEAVDPGLVGFGPDTGQIAKAGGDPVAVLRKHADRLNHVHFKDWSGGRPTPYGEYEPLGLGVVDLQGLIEIMDDSPFDGILTVELDGGRQRIRPPREAARIARQWLEAVLGDRAIWGTGRG